jgi:hypothetical protein
MILSAIEVLYSILIEFGLSMKVVRLIKMCLNEMYSKSYISKHLSAHGRFEVFVAVTMKNAERWDVTPCGSCKN